MWAQELRRADERADKFKDEAEKLRSEKQTLIYENSELAEKVQAREMEISRLHSSYKGGQTFNEVKKSFQDQKNQEETQIERDEFEA